MEHNAEMQVYKEIIDKLRQLMAMEASEEETGVQGTPFKSAAPEAMEELSEAMGEDEDKAEDAEKQALQESGLKDEMKAFFGGGKPLMPGKKGLKVGVTEIAVMPGKKKLKY